MCRNIKTLFNFEPAATEDEIRAASLQFVRKVSGTRQSSKVNEIIFETAIDDIASVVSSRLHSMVSFAQPKDRDIETAKAREHAVLRFSQANSNGQG